MDAERLKRYKEKIDLIEERMGDLNEWLNIDLEEFLGDKKTKLASYKAFQEIVEAFMDIFSMIIRDMKILVEDDYSNINNLFKKNFLNLEERNLLKNANGLRNRLIHRYNSLDDEIAYSNIKEMLGKFEEILRKVKEWIKEYSGK